jgi:dTDP-4-dehydrorhamnose 3,5-epimerase
MIFTETPLKGAFVIDLEPHHDDRGFFARTFCEREFSQHGIIMKCVQTSVSFNIRAGTIRGMHFQAPPMEEAKLVRCLSGGIHDVVVDLRPESPTYKCHFEVTLTAENRRALFVPESFAHGFQTLLDNTEVLYQMNKFFTPGYSHGFRYNDPAFAGIKWPIPVSVVSKQDLEWKHFS